MKRNAQLWMAAGLVLASLLVGCKKKEPATFTAETEKGGNNNNNAKTELVDTKLHWLADDQIVLANSASPVQSETLSLDEGAGTSEGKFHASLSFALTPPYKAAYGLDIDGSVSLPSSQTLTTTEVTSTTANPQGTIANNIVPMVATSNDTKLYFKNLIGGLCFKLTGSVAVSQIQIVSDINEKLWGNFTADFTTAEMTYKNDNSGSNTITVDCSGVTLSSTDQYFAVMLPPGTLESGYTLNVYSGSTVVKTLHSNGSANLVERSKIKTSHTAINVVTYQVNASANPTAGGTVNGGGIFGSGASCTVTATPNTGYNFVNWTEGGNVVSTNASYTISSVTSNHNLVANFALINYTVSATVSPANSGSVSGTGSYSHGSSCTLTATPAANYSFTSWTEGGTVVSTSASYTIASVTSNHSLVANFTYVPPTYTIAVSANPTAGGTVSGGGTFNSGASCTVSASAASGYRFRNWTESGTVVSTSASYTFTVSSNRTLVANFDPLYTVSVSAGPTSSYGSASGGNTYASGTNCTVTASASSYNEFVNWTENGSVVSTNASYTFTVTGNRTLVANFKPIGALKGQFYVGTWVWFSQGNLQYNNGATWRFATNQWDRIGGTAQYTSENTGARDIFGWARNGINHCGTPSNQNWHQPYTLGYYSGYYYCNVFTANGGHENNMSGTSDWGYNAISNGGDAANIGWRTLTSAEWTNLLNNQNWRTVYCNSVLGLLIYPYGVAATVSNGATIDATLLDNTGAVFLPVAGARSTGNSGWYWDQSSLTAFRNSLRYNGSFSQVDYNTAGYYWSATSRTDWDWYYKYCLVFSSGNATVDYMRNMNGACVRLVKNR